MLQHTWTKCNTTAQCRDHVCCSTRSHQAHWWHQTASTLMRMSAHTHARTCTHVDVDAHTHVYTRIEGHANTDIDAHVHTHACTSCPNAVCMHVYVSTGVLVTRARTHARMHEQYRRTPPQAVRSPMLSIYSTSRSLSPYAPPSCTHARTRTRAHVRTHARWQELCYTLIQCGPLPSLSRCGHVCRHLHGHVRAASCILQVPSAWRTSILLHACCMSHATCRMSAYHIAATDSHVTCCMSCVVPLRRVCRPLRPW